MMHKGDPYIKLYSNLSRVRISSSILSQLNILCTTLVKLYHTKIIIHPLFTVDMLRRIYMFSNVLNFIEAVTSIYQNVQYFIRTVLRSAWTEHHQTWREHRAMIAALQFYFRVEVYLAAFSNAGSSKWSDVENDAKFRTF